MIAGGVLSGWLEELDRLAASRAKAGLTRQLSPRPTAVDLAGNDYLGLAGDPRVTAAAAEALSRYGLGATGSRLVRGSTPAHAALESELAAWLGTPAALVFSSGYMANLAAVRSMATFCDLIVSDAYNHASLIDGCRMATPRTIVAPHNSPSAVAAILDAHAAATSTSAALLASSAAVPPASSLAVPPPSATIPQAANSSPAATTPQGATTPQSAATSPAAATTTPPATATSPVAATPPASSAVAAAYPGVMPPSSVAASPASSAPLASSAAAAASSGVAHTAFPAAAPPTSPGAVAAACSAGAGAGAGVGVGGVGRPLALVVTESVFSVDGDLAPLAELYEVTSSRGALLLVDDAHALGLLGPGGAGGVAAAGLAGRPDVVITATLSKSLGGAGGVVAGPAQFIKHLVDTGRTFIYDTALPPAVAAGVQESLRIARAADDRREVVAERAARAVSRLRAAGFDVKAPAAGVLSVVAPGPEAALAWAADCRDRGVAVGCFRPPSTPDGTSRLRLTLNAGVSDSDFARALDVIVECAP